ncbi:MAG: YfcE family phosphodiesterase [Oscillospiraceae bacterium]|nr:YfcE family phosphodiesterase [Oscillospiraceae bacterium]
MKIVVMSDSHGVRQTLEMVMNKQPDADLYIHLGDGEREVHAFLMSHPEYQERFRYLCGNCDSGFLVDPTLDKFVMTLPYGHKIFAAHGHAYQVKYGTNRMRFDAREANADIVLYGHTHMREYRYEDGVHIVNPGSLGAPRDGKRPGFALIDVCESGVSVNLVELTR